MRETFYKSLKLSCALAALTLVTAGTVSAQTAKNTEKQDKQTERPERTDRSGQQSSKSGQQQTRSSTKIYLGPAVKQSRQQGHVTGKPLSIRPEPFIAPGSLPLTNRPGAPVGQAAEQDTNADPLADNLATSNELGLEGQTEDFSAVSPLDSPAGATAPTQEELLIAGEQLNAVDPSVISINGNRHRADLWQGYTHQTASETLSRMAATPLSGPGRRIARSLAKGRFNLSAANSLETTETAQSAFDPTNTRTGTLTNSPSDTDILGLLQARLMLLETIGDAGGYQALLSRLPAEGDWSTLNREQAAAALYRGDLVNACELANQARETDSDSFWVKVAVMCAAARGDRGAVDFQLEILETLTSVEPSFYALSDMILVEAETGPNANTAGSSVTLNSPLTLNSLSVAMARLARTNINAVDLTGATPIGMQAALSLPNLSQAARAPIQDTLLSLSIIDAPTVLTALNIQTLDSANKDTLLSRAETDTSFAVDEQLLLLLKDTNQTLEDRQSALILLWQRAKQHNRLDGIAPLLLTLGHNLPGRGDIIDAIRTRAGLTAGQHNLALSYFNNLRATGVAEQPALADALLSVAPLIALSNAESAPRFNNDLFSRWLSVKSDTPTSNAQAILLLSLAEALAAPITGDTWALLEGRDLNTGTQHAAPVVRWRKLMSARAQSDRPQMLLTSLELLGDQDPLTLSPAMLGSIIATIREMGEVETARALALDLLIRAGL